MPRDIDYIKNLDGSQVILYGGDPPTDLISRTSSDGILAVLLVALQLKEEVTIQYDPGESKSVWLKSVALAVMAKDEQGYVSTLSFDEKDEQLRATVFDQSKKVQVWTSHPQMQDILTTAVCASIPVHELAYDPKTYELTRGKLNIDPPEK